MEPVVDDRCQAKDHINGCAGSGRGEIVRNETQSAAPNLLIIGQEVGIDLKRTTLIFLNLLGWSLR